MSAAGWVNVLLLARGLHHRFHFGRDTWRRIALVVLACAAMAGAMWAGRFLFGPWTAAPHAGWFRLAALVSWCGAGGLLYGVLLLALRATSLAELKSSFRR